MGRSSVALVLAAAALAGCGADEERAATTATVAVPTAPKLRCVPARTPGFRLCAHDIDAPPRVPATIQRRGDGGWTVLASGPPGTIHDGLQIGHWENAWLSPDGKTLLAQWLAECEIPIAFFLDAKTGAMRPVTGEKVWTEAPQSIALGWGADGRAWVRLTKGYCGGTKHPPGVYLIDARTGKLTRAAARG